jgi:hypothetical protein
MKILASILQIIFKCLCWTTSTLNIALRLQPVLVLETEESYAGGQTVGVVWRLPAQGFRSTSDGECHALLSVESSNDSLCMNHRRLAEP